VLRQQINVLRRTAPKRLLLSSIDRLTERAIWRSSAMTLSAELGSRLATGSSATMSRGLPAAPTPDRNASARLLGSRSHLRRATSAADPDLVFLLLQ